MTMAEVISLENPVFRLYLGHASVVILKSQFMALLTAYRRLKYKAFANEEDTKIKDGGPEKCPVNPDHPLVERVRRCHLNDIENVPFFCLLGLLYVSSRPSYSEAAWHFRLFTVARLCHSLVYVTQLRQPLRGLTFITGFLTSVSMGVRVISRAAAF